MRLAKTLGYSASRAVANSKNENLDAQRTRRFVRMAVVALCSKLTIQSSRSQEARSLVAFAPCIQA